jgi:hypothetical protein
MKKKTDYRGPLKRYYDNRELRLAQQAEYRKKNKDKHAKTAGRNWEVANPDRALWLGARRRARKHGIPFDLEASDVVIPSHCPISGVELKMSTRESGKRDNAPSLDRIKPELGYVKGNVIVVSWRMNRIKSDGTWQELLRLGSFYKTLGALSVNLSDAAG